MNQKIALYGGSFDPPHLGHLAVVEEALRTLDIDKLIVVPAFQNPFKNETHASSTLRLKWLKKIFEGNKRVEISDFEVTQNRSVSSFETVSHFQKSYEKIYFIIGADNLPQLTSWNNFEKLNKLITWVVASRDKRAIAEDFIQLNVDVAVSSSEIRENPSHFKHPKQLSVEIIDFYKINKESK